MTTRPHHDYGSIATDAQRTEAAARKDLSEPEFKKRISRHELDGYAANIARLQAVDGGRSETLHAQIASGTHAANVRGLLWIQLANVRDDAKIAFPDDTAQQHAFGVGANPSRESNAQLEHLAHEVLAAARKHPTEAAKVGLDTHGIHALEDLVQALTSAELAHVHAANNRHTNSTATDSLAHLVSAETAHIRLVARRVFRGNDEKLSAYASTLPRHEVHPRTPGKAPATAG